MTKKRFLTAVLFAITITMVLSACKKDELISSYKEADLTIFTTIYPIEFIVEEIGDEIINVQSVYPPGVDAHTYEPTTKDMTKIATSDAFIYFGPSMEGFVDSAANALDGEEVQLISLEQYDELFDLTQADVSEGIENEKETNIDETAESAKNASDNHQHGTQNPHVWIDPLRMMVMTQIITEQLIELAPEHEELFKQNKNDLIVRLQKLDELFEETIAVKENKYMIVPHAAYGYWEERYGIEQIPISGLSPSEEPSQKYLTNIIETAQQYDINYLFYEQNTPDKLIEIIKDQINAKTYTIHNLAVLTEKDVEHGDDYITLMERNVNVLNEAFE